MKNNTVLHYWGKAGTNPHMDASTWHPLAYHGLDVAAVGWVMLAKHHRLRRSLAEAFGLEEERFMSWMGFFLAIHDVGKFSEGFQNLRPDLLLALQGKESGYGCGRHGDLGYLLCQVEIEGIWPLLVGECCTGNRHVKIGLDFWAAAVTGHHGQPPKEENNAFYVLECAFSRADRQAVKQFVESVAALLLPDPGLPPSFNGKGFQQASKYFSWWIAGLAVLADWIGSDQQEFPFQPGELPLDRYWQETLARAGTAVAKAGVLPESSAPIRSFAALFPALSLPTPLQRLATTLPLEGGPQLLILEDLTGAGKTEAAMILVHRLMAMGASDGLYMALPTMATANAMYGRMAIFYRRLFAADSHPSLVLAHGARDLSTVFRQSILPHGRTGGEYQKNEPSASAHCAAWLADGRKKALLAHVGIGTIDQALLAILYAKHQSLRLLGLFGKVLVVDEVHANDAYMHLLLRTLLRFHHAAGGSAILLSATLPKQMRQELATSYHPGIFLQETAYPLLTKISGNQLQETPVAVRAGLERWVTVALVHSQEEVVEYVVEKAQAGRCVCWIRNTVANAREAYGMLSQRLTPERLELFHARFAMGDRLDIEERVMESFGKKSEPAQRQGRVVVATQVVEQSLDLDFDEMVSDLAPIDLLIQRAGRLHRHERCEERGEPILVIYGPKPEGEVAANWYKAVFPQAAAVYPDHASLWLSARLLWEKKGFSLAKDARTLIEGVYGPETRPYPAALEMSRLRNTGNNNAMAAQGRFNTLPLEEGYVSHATSWWDEGITPTRLGEPESTLRLARWDGQQLTPWCAGPQGWALSQVKIRQCFVKEAFYDEQPGLLAAVTELNETLPDKGLWSLLLALIPTSDGWWQGLVKNEQEQRTTLYYHPHWGLVRETERP